MPNLNSSFKEILSDLEKNIKDKEDLEYVKVQIFNLYNLFFEEITNLEELANNRVAEIARTQTSIDEKIDEITKGLKSIEEDIYGEENEDEDEDYEFSVLCPYCDKDFVVEIDEIEDEIVCPLCNNKIELDWGDDCDCDCGCDCDDCDHSHNEDDDM